jgi:hypothetical protein
MSGFSLHTTWAEDEQGSYGPGVSRPKDGEQTKEFRVLVKLPGAKPLTWITRAPSQREALKYAKARWPLAVSTIIK